MLERIASLLKMQPPAAALNGLLSLSGTTVPTDGDAGYATGCIFQKTDGGAGTSNYQNEGSATSCAFAAVAALTGEQEALLGATGGINTASKALIVDANKHLDVVETASLKLGATGATTAVTATAAELNQLDATVFTAGSVLAGLTPGTGISAGSGTVHASSVEKIGSLFKTTILVDLTGLRSTGADDVIGIDGTANPCHWGQLTAAVNGTIVHGSITCIETPAGGDPDVDLCVSTAADAKEEDDVTGLAGYANCLNHGDWTGALATPILITTFPAADDYLYLAAGAATDADYTAGIFLIELWGV